MTVVLTLPADLEARVKSEAQQRSISVEDYLTEVVAAAIPTPAETERRNKMLAALDSLRDLGSEEEQASTFEYLAKAIDEDRTSDRKLFG